MVARNSNCAPSTGDPKAAFDFFKWLYQQCGFDIEKQGDQVLMVQWLADIKGDLQLESSVFSCFDPEISREEYTVDPSRYLAISVKEKTQNCTLVQPSWNKDRFCMLNSVLRISDGNVVNTVVVNIVARQHGETWKLIELKRTRI
jgi:hypothetical protein